jgi:septum formation protein
MYSQLLLASSSRARSDLLRAAQIPFRVIFQHADERSCSWDMPVEQLVLSLASLKMNHARIPDDIDETVLCIVTADTVVLDAHDVIYGKPEDRDHAREMIAALCDQPARIVTGMRLERRMKQGNVWVTDKAHEVVDEAQAVFVIPQKWASWFIHHASSLDVAGAVIADGVGLRFVRWISGSPATVQGLPMFRLQQLLDQMGFFAGLAE